MHALAEPVTTGFKHALVLLQLSAVGQLSIGSQVSPPSIIPLPHAREQSLSVFAFAPSGQQPSCGTGVVISGAATHRCEQPLPSSRLGLQASSGGQLTGHAPG